MKLPKTVVIAGKSYRIIIDPKTDGGEWSSEGWIKVNPHCHEPVETIFMHEVMEAVLTMRNCRYASDENCEKVFMFGHRDFTSAMQDFACAIRPMLAKRRKP